jgi:hypothetical protein
VPKNTFSINDPIHGLIQFRDDEAIFVKKILQTPEFQRLRHIKQLGMAFYIYPGATHNRFSHSIGVAYLSKRIIQKLQADYPQSEIEKLKLLAIACGLLHDVGHGPYSHLFEKAEYEGIEIKFNHEEMTLLIIERICANPIFNNEERECLTQAIQILNKKNTLPKDLSLMRGLVSSQLDTDRMDYLLRDSHFCGVTYGNYDLKWLIHSIELYPEESHNYLCINKKAIGVAENYLIARRLMTNCVYKHRKIVALEFICSKFIEQVFKKINELEKSIGYKNQPIIKYLSQLKKKQNLEKCLNEYIYICDYDLDILITMLVNDPSHEKNDYSVIAKKIYKREIPVTYEIDFTKYDEAKILIDEWKGNHPDFCDWQLHLDKRSIVTFKDEEKEKIFINDNNSIKLLQHLSLPIFSFTNKNEINPLLIVDKMICNAPSVFKLVEKLNLKNCFTGHVEINGK